MITIHINNNDNNNKNNNNNLLLLFLVLLLFCCCGTFSTVYLHLNLYASFMYLKASDNNYTGFILKVALSLLCKPEHID